MRYQLVDITNKPKKISVRCLDKDEKAILKVSLDPVTLECIDPFIPDSLQNFIGSNQDFILNHLNHFYEMVFHSETI
jgi:hypothetical protein